MSKFFSRIQPNSTDRNSRAEENSFYPAMSRHSERILEQYKSQSQQEERKCLDDTYNSFNSGSEEDHGQDRNEDLNHSSFDKQGLNKYRQYDISGKQRRDGDGENSVYSPDQYSTGNILEQLEAEIHRDNYVSVDHSARKLWSDHLTLPHNRASPMGRTIDRAQGVANFLDKGGSKSISPKGAAGELHNFRYTNSPSRMWDTGSNSHASFHGTPSLYPGSADMLRANIEKCMRLEAELKQKDQAIQDYTREAHRTQENMEKLRLVKLSINTGLLSITETFTICIRTENIFLIRFIRIIGINKVRKQEPGNERES